MRLRGPGWVLRIDPFSYGKDSESHLNWKPEKKP
jgi:hypothetical protein